MTELKGSSNKKERKGKERGEKIETPDPSITSTST